MQYIAKLSKCSETTINDLAWDMTRQSYPLKKIFKGIAVTALTGMFIVPLFVTVPTLVKAYLAMRDEQRGVKKQLIALRDMQIRAGINEKVYLQYYPRYKFGKEESSISVIRGHQTRATMASLDPENVNPRQLEAPITKTFVDHVTRGFNPAPIKAIEATETQPLKSPA